MFKDTSKFQLVVIGLFAVSIVGGLIGFALFKGNKGNLVPTTVIWGTLPTSSFSNFTQRVSAVSKNAIRIKYVYQDPATFDDALVEAIATNKGPDAILVSQQSLLKQSNKILPLPYSSYPEATFKSTFIPEGELFFGSKGLMAVPFSIDPIVLYWNRTLLTNANISQPPHYWDELLTMAPMLTQKDDAGNITQSAIGLGEYANITHSKDILNMLMLQAGNPLVVLSNGKYNSTLSASLNNTIVPADSALTFYTQFADPRKNDYSWNRGLTNSKSMFLSNKLALYVGYASELGELQTKNPNLDFDVTAIPQVRAQNTSQQVSATFGQMYGFSVLKTSKNIPATLTTINAMTSKPILKLWSNISGLPSVRRDSLATDPSDAAGTIFSAAALMSRGWLDPDTIESENVYKNLIESVTSGRASYSEAIRQAENSMQDLLRKIKL